MRYLSEALAAIIVFDLVGRVQAHGWPIVACNEGSVSKAVSLRVVSALTLMEFG